MLDGWTGAKHKSENRDQPVKKLNACIAFVVLSDCDCEMLPMGVSGRGCSYE